MKPFKNARGFALVGTVVVASLLLITAAGFIRIVTNASLQEASAFENECAFAAAESGIHLGARWLRGQEQFPGPNQTFNPFTGFEIENTGCYVNVTINSFLNGSDTVAEIISDAYNDENIHTVNSFQKRISFTARKLPYGAHATVIDSIYNDHENWEGFYRCTFDGPFHMNTWIEIHNSSFPGSGNEVIFNGPVTVADNFEGNYGIGSPPYNNNYNHDLELNFLGDADDCDQIFRNRYMANVEKIGLPEGLTADDFMTNPQKIILPTSILDEGIASFHYRPTLEFTESATGPGGSMISVAKYHYKDENGLNETTINNYDGKILICQNNLNVLGTVDGKVTVATVTGKSIFPVDDIVYKNYYNNNKTIPSDCPSILGLVSGRYFVFNYQWKKEWLGIEEYPYITGTLDITASMIAVEEEIGSWQGCEYWSHYHPCDYDLKVNGNHILKAWRAPTDDDGGGCKGHIEYIHDRRLIDKIKPPGFPEPNVQTQNGLLMLSIYGWLEQNNYHELFP